MASNIKQTALMAHLVAGYPNMTQSKEAALGLIAGGADYLEVQFPFSDPTADGPSIEEACTLSLKNGFKKEQGFSLIRELSQAHPEVDLFIMCYANTAFSSGIAEFCQLAADAGAYGLIIPDLPPDYDESLYGEAKKAGLTAIPVVAPSIAPIRLKMIAKTEPDFIYCAIRSGITGSKSEISPEVINFLKIVKKEIPNANLLAGFGLQNHSQIKTMASLCDTAVAGSWFVKTIKNAIVDNKPIQNELKKAANRLKNG